ncbi:MAG: SLC13 family permease [Sinobacteraceae bacterium]|nr:SLC13 family permease [Nevskiaceae bacterium]
MPSTEEAAARRPALQLRLAAALRRDPVLAALALLTPLLLLLAPLPARDWIRLPDWSTLEALAGLLVLTRAIEHSGYLQHAAILIVDRIRSLRGLALALASLSAALSTVLTNDVTLFLVVPLTISIARVAAVPLSRLVIFEALAVNAGSMLTPVGNPQNLFLWHRSGLGMPAFIAQMLPATALVFALLCAAIFLAFPRRPVQLRLDQASARRDIGLLAFGALGLTLFLLALHLHWALPAAVAVVVLAAGFARRALAEADWSLLAVIALMFLALGALAALPPVAAVLARLPLAQAWAAYWSGVIVAQGISNVPAAILLARDGVALPALAYGVNVGGFGLAIGSLANLIALRLAGGGAIYREFHRISLPFLLIAAVAVYALLP